MRTRALMLMLIAGLMAPLPALAQTRHHAERQPAEGSIAVEGGIGFFVPQDSAFGTALDLEGHGDFYLTSRLGVRFGVDWTDPSFHRESSDSLRQVRFGGDVIYNWEGGKWHPFVGAGAGAYFLQFKDNGESLGESETKPGFNLGGGVEYFTGRTVSLKGEARYHVIGKTRGGQDPSGLVFTGGIKKYW